MSKNYNSNLSQFSKNMFNRNCLQKSKKVCKNRKSNKKFHCNKKKNRKKNYGKNCKNNKVTKA